MPEGQQVLPRLNRCGKCGQYKDYPLFKVPLGPPDFTENPKAKKMGFDMKDGVVLYSWFCLPCTQEWSGRLTESFLRDGTVEVPNPSQETR